jgi:ketosteroid isomerase-like protein
MLAPVLAVWEAVDERRQRTSMVASEFDRFVEQYHQALDEFFRGNPEPDKRLYSHREDASLANPFGPVASGWEEVAEVMDRAASNYRDGGATGFESVAAYVTPDLAYTVEIERFQAKVGGKDENASGALRVTSVFRREDGAWKIAHRHADPITTRRPAESVIQNQS